MEMNVSGFAAQHYAIVDGDTDLDRYFLNLIHKLESSCQCNGERHFVKRVHNPMVLNEGQALEAAARYAVGNFHEQGRVYVCVVARSKQGKRKAGSNGVPLVVGSVAYDS